ncbi:hypothetical protein Tco_1126594 [Tanacetum coccineum]
MEEDSKASLILGRPFLYTANAVIRVKQKQLNLGVGTERMIFNIDYAIKHSYSNDDTCFSIDAIDKILEEDFDALLDEGIIYLIADSPWVSPIHCVPKKGGVTVVTNEKDELVPIRTVTGWRVCIDYRKLNEATMNDHFPLPFMDQMEKCHFMVKEGIMLGYKVSEAGLEVDKAKIDVISKLPPPTNIKGIRSFLRHASFYRRFIKDLSKIALPLTKLLEKDTSFEFDGECHNAFKLLKERLTCALVIASPT